MQDLEHWRNFKASLVYIASTRLAWTVEGDSVSKTSWRLGGGAFSNQMLPMDSGHGTDTEPESQSSGKHGR